MYTLPVRNTQGRTPYLPVEPLNRFSIGLLRKQREQLDRELATYVGGSFDVPIEDWRKAVRQFGATAKRIAGEIARLEAGGLPQRPPRQMPSLKRIALHHGLGPDPYCVRCGVVGGEGSWAAANAWLERAHVIDRVFDGLDIESNLLPLCGGCHRQQPIFEPGDECAALRWFRRTPEPWRREECALNADMRPPMTANDGQPPGCA